MPAKRMAIVREAAKKPVRPHQPGGAIFKAVLPEGIDWKPFSAFPPSVRLAVVVGQPSLEGPYTIRVKVPRGVKAYMRIQPRVVVPRVHALKASLKTK